MIGNKGLWLAGGGLATVLAVHAHATTPPQPIQTTAPASVDFGHLPAHTTPLGYPDAHAHGNTIQNTSATVPVRRTRIHTAQYNVHNTTTAQQTIADLAKIMRHSDVITLNELEGDAKRHAVLAFASANGFGHYYGRGQTAILFRKSKYSAHGGGFMKLNNPAVVEQKHGGHADTLHKRSQFANYVHLTDRATGATFAVATAHTESGVREHGWNHKRRLLEREQFTNLARLVRKLSTTTPVLLQGDFNTGPTLPAWPRLILAHANLRSNWTVANMRHRKYGTFHHSFIDNILSTAHFRLIRQRILAGLHSDHNAVLAEYALRTIQ